LKQAFVLNRFENKISQVCKQRQRKYKERVWFERCLDH